MLERLPCTLEEHPLLRIDELGLARGEAEQRGVEAVNVVNRGVGRHVAWVIDERDGQARGQELFTRQPRDRLHAAAQVSPELVEIAGAGQAQGGADDRDLCPGAVHHLFLRVRATARA